MKNVKDEKHKTILFLIYSSGLRIGEVVTLKFNNIDKKRMMIHIRQGKGRKARCIVLSKIALEQLRKYYNLYKLKLWLFEGGNGKEHISERSVQKVFKSACSKVNIKKSVTIHT